MKQDSKTRFFGKGMVAMDKNIFDVDRDKIAWCPGCGDFGILNVMKQALAELEISPQQLVMVSGIGQAAKLPQYLKCNYFNGLHGRSLPPATGIKAVNPVLTVITESGDGCTYGEGGNHFIHAIRRNPNITNIVHDNMVYGLTKGQASPTSRKGFVTPVQWDGVFLEPFNPISVAIALDASFVARAFIGDAEKTKDIVKQAIRHKGYALVDILQPCVSFNKLNTYAWYKENTYYLEPTHNPQDRTAAFQRAIEEDKLPLGVFYINPNKTTFEENLAAYRRDPTPILNQKVNRTERLNHLMESYR
jgi:2-oxoglutarate/2-oxoacid ferredoxin oxidoreductase subunit beta